MFLTLVIKINGIPKDDAAENGMGEIYGGFRQGNFLTPKLIRSETGSA